MNQNVQPHSGAWVTFTYVSFSASAFMVAIGVFFLPLDLWIKGYLAMGIVMLVQSCVTLTKTVRDMHESGKLVNRIEDAKAERLLMEVSKAASFQGRVTCDADLAKADGGCLGIRRLLSGLGHAAVRLTHKACVAEGLTSMKRTLVFLLLGSTLVYSEPRRFVCRRGHREWRNLMDDYVRRLRDDAVRLQPDCIGDYRTD